MTDNIQKLPLKVIPRVETGPVEFEGDWPGVFIRGDNAFGYAMYLRTIIDEYDGEDMIAWAGAKGLLSLLESCIVKPE